MSLQLRVRSFILLAALTFMLMTPAFAVTSIQSSTEVIKSQWSRSPHAGSMDNDKEKVRMNKTGCAHCHTAEGYWEVTLEGNPSSAPYTNPVGLTCVTCHFSEKGNPKGSALRTGIDTACNGCHDVIVQNDTEDFSTTPQGSIVKGKGGKHFNDKRYDKPYGTSAHSKIEKNCAGCHMAQPQNKQNAVTGGHTFRVITKGDMPRLFNANGCKSCHQDITYDFVKKFQNKIKQKMAVLEALLPHQPEGKTRRKNELPRLPEDPTLTKIEAMAAYNYYQVLRDGTYGVHNPIYIDKLLDQSIEALKGQSR